MQVKNNPPPSSCWSDDQDTLLKKLQEADIELSDTALSSERLKLQQQAMAYLISTTEEERAASNLPVELLDGINSFPGKSGEKKSYTRNSHLIFIAHCCVIKTTQTTRSIHSLQRYYY